MSRWEIALIVILGLLCGFLCALLLAHWPVPIGPAP